MAKSQKRQITIEEVDRFTFGNEQVLRQRVKEKAYELYRCRGCRHGRDLDDWLEAEQLVLNEIAGERDQ